MINNLLFLSTFHSSSLWAVSSAYTIKTIYIASNFLPLGTFCWLQSLSMLHHWPWVFCSYLTLACLLKSISVLKKNYKKKLRLFCFFGIVLQNLLGKYHLINTHSLESMWADQMLLLCKVLALPSCIPIVYFWHEKIKSSTNILRRQARFFCFQNKALINLQNTSI